jgi:capsular polysaccharide biosynthesis protein
MTQPRWDVPDVEEDEQASEQPNPVLVSLHFIRTTLRRRWLVCALSAVLGLLMAVGFLVLFPQIHRATSSLVLGHEEGVDPSAAMSTDVGLLRSHAVAAKTIAKLRLAMTPTDFLKSLTIEQVSPELLSLTLEASTDEEAVRRLAALTSVYLQFRGEQLTLQSGALSAAKQERIEKLEGEVTALSRRIDQLAQRGSANANGLSETVGHRASIQSRIEDMQQSIEDATLRNSAVVSASRVIDPAEVEDDGAKLRVLLVLASGLIGGTAFGCGIVLFLAITSDRIRRRSDVAGALEAPVPISVQRITPLPKMLRRLPYLRVVDIRRTWELQRLAQAIEQELPLSGRWGRLTVGCVDNADEVRFAVATAARDLAEDGRTVALIDLTEQGNLADMAPSLRPEESHWHGAWPGRTDSTDGQMVLRPPGIPALAGNAADLRAVSHEEDDRGPHWPQLTDVTLVLADLDPLVGADHLKAWSDRVIAVVTAGRTSAERLRTIAELVRAAGLDLRFGALLHVEVTDDSSGVLNVDRPPPVDLGDEYEQPKWLARSQIP